MTADDGKSFSRLVCYAIMRLLYTHGIQYTTYIFTQ